MRLLVLGGTRFLSQAIAADAVARGHQVTCAARGESGDVPAGARHVVLDREAPDWSALEGDWDAVVDVARTPSWVAGALDALADRIPHWTFVSTISVYADRRHARRQPGHVAAAPADHRGRRAGHPGGVRREQGGLRAGRAGAGPGGTGRPARADRGSR